MCIYVKTRTDLCYCRVSIIGESVCSTYSAKYQIRVYRPGGECNSTIIILF